VGKGGFNWRLNCLNDALGPLRQGDFIVVGTRPDTGKTTLLASESTFIATQDERPVLWLNNEEGGKKVLRRIIQSALGWPTHKMESEAASAAAEYNKLYGRDDKFIVYDNAYISTKDVEALCKKYNPCLIIFDQLWKIKGYDTENEVTRLTMLFNWGREIAKAYAPVITVHQADGTAEGQKWIDMSQLYMSKTGIQGEADAIITMGRTPETGNSRYLYVPKNKMSGSVPHLRNGKFELEIIGDTARFREPT
jgi:replicative DNA helicase